MTKKIEINYATSFTRTIAAAIDVFIVLLLRVITIQLLGSWWINQKFLDFLQDFKNKFGEVNFSNTNPEHVQFLSNHEFATVALASFVIVVMVGAIYHSYLNSSSWSATIGKRLTGVILVKNEGKTLSFWQALGHYLFSLIPWVFTFYILMYSVNSGVGMFKAIIANPTNIILAVATAIWLQIHIFTKKRNTVQDMIIGCTMVKGKLKSKWPKLSS